jgi:hypothetical protein
LIGRKLIGRKSREIVGAFSLRSKLAETVPLGPDRRPFLGRLKSGVFAIPIAAAP